MINMRKTSGRNERDSERQRKGGGGGGGLHRARATTMSRIKSDRD